MTQDEQHLNLLSVFHYVMGALTALFSCFPFLHLTLGIAMVSGAFENGDGPPQVLGWLFIIFPVLFIILGWTLAVFIVIAGKKLKKRVSRTFCLVIAGLECIVMPFGTVLGIFTIIVLMRESVQKLFSNPNNP
ncbi:MAG: hypothetical protein R6V04_08435 [bacterium]